MRYVAQWGYFSFAVTADRQTVYIGNQGMASNPEHPVQTSEVPVTHAEDIALDGDYAYVVNTGKTRAGDFSDDVGLRVVARSDSTSLKGGAFDTDGSPTSVAVAGSYAYVAEGPVRIIDVSNPARPRKIGTFAEDVDEVIVRGERAYLAGRGGLQVFDISDPTSPRILGTLALDDLPADLALSGAFAYVAVNDLQLGDDADGVNHGLRIVDISEPSVPREVAAFDTPGPISGVAVDGRRACITYTGYRRDEPERLQVIDVTDPTALQPSETFVLENPAGAEVVGGGIRVMDIAVTEGYAYVAGWHAGVVAVELPRE
jgi:hypothetical protein